MDVLELIRLLLPRPVTFYANFNTSENHFFTTSEIYPQLDDIAVLDGVKSRLLIWLTEPNMVQEGPGRTGDISDLPLPIGEAEFTMLTADNFRFEAHRSLGRTGRVGDWWAFPLRIPANSNDAALAGQSS